MSHRSFSLQAKTSLSRTGNRHVEEREDPLLPG